MNALLRAVLVMRKYEQRRKEEGGYPSAQTEALLHRAEVYALIAQAQEARAANERAGTNRGGLPDEYTP